MKYRRLRPDELAELEEDFIRFLAANGLTGPDWERIKAEQAERADQLIDLFSDMVYDRTLEKIEYLEFKMAADIKTFHCREDKIILNGLMVEGKSDIDFTLAQDPAQMAKLLSGNGAKLKLYTAEKAYRPSRKEELFRMMEGGALISRDGALFKTLEGLKQG